MTQPDRPNILYIFSDQHAARVMGCAGDMAAETPYLDKLAQEGARFTRAYCPSPVCLPSRMSMLTGQHPHVQSCWTNDDILDSARPTWLHGLGAVGYRPTLIGRMHALGPDQLRGYVSRPIGDHSPNWPGVARSSLGALAKTSGPFRDSIEKSGPGQHSYQLMDEDVLRESIAFLHQHAARKSADPFCLTASFMLPHPPYVAKQDDFDAVASKVELPRLPAPNDEHPWLAKWRAVKGIESMPVAEIHRARCSYYAMVRELDRAIGELLLTLEEVGCAENTLVIYVSDHGDHIGERGLFWKHTLYEESISVPLIMRWPGHIAAGSKISHPVETGGLGGTILSLVGAPALPNATMASFDGLLRGSEPAKDQPIFVEYCTDDIPTWAERLAVQQRAIVFGRHKYVYYHGFPAQLFDLKEDPDEVNNLVDDSKARATANRLRKMVLADWEPERIAAEIEMRKADKLLLKAWAEATQPKDKFRWDVQESQNYLLPRTQQAV